MKLYDLDYYFYGSSFSSCDIRAKIENIIYKLYPIESLFIFQFNKYMEPAIKSIRKHFEVRDKFLASSNSLLFSFASKSGIIKEN